MTIAASLEPGQNPEQDLEPRVLDAEPLWPGESGRVADIPVDVWNRLTAPFDADQIEKRPQVSCWKCTGNKKRPNGKELCDEHPRKVRCADCDQFITPGHIHLNYVGHAGITMRLNDVLTPAGWNWRPMAFTPAGTPLMSDGGMWIYLTIGGVTRIGFGDAAGKSMTPSAVKEIIGDGIRNAGMRYGIATYLWSKSNAAERLKDLPVEPEEDYATSLAVAGDLGELYLAASRLKLAVEAGAVSEALASLLRHDFNERRAAFDADQQRSAPIRLPDDHWEAPATGSMGTARPPVVPGRADPEQVRAMRVLLHEIGPSDPDVRRQAVSDLIGRHVLAVDDLTAAQVQKVIDHYAELKRRLITDTAPPTSADAPTPGSGLLVIPALAGIEVEPPHVHGESEDFLASLAATKNPEAVDRVEGRFTDRFNGHVINGTLFVDLAMASAARRTELGAASAMHPAGTALSVILTRAAESTRSLKDVGRIHALIHHHAAAGNLTPDVAADLMEQCRQVYRAVSIRADDTVAA